MGVLLRVGNLYFGLSNSSCFGSLSFGSKLTINVIFTSYNLKNEPFLFLFYFYCSPFENK